MENVQAVSELALTLGQGAVYEMLSPLERLYEHPAAEVRAAVLRGVGTVYLARSYGLIRKGLVDPALPVFNEALRVLRQMHFVDGLEPATRIFRESTDERVRLAALEGIAGITSGRRRWCSSRPFVRRPGRSARRPRRCWRGSAATRW